MKRRLLLGFIIIMGIIIVGCDEKLEEEFIGTITEINDQMAIVYVDESEEIRNSGNLVEVSLTVSDDFEFQVNDRVRVVHKGLIQEKHPLGIETISVELIERDEKSEKEPSEQEDNTTYTKINQYLKEMSIETFAPYYELLEFRITDYKEEIVDGKVESKFLYTIVSKNYDRDPDTAGYIKEAKESGNENYQQMYDEYLQPNEMNFDFKTVIGEDGLITLYSNVSPKGIQWEETKMDDYIIRENSLGFVGLGYDLDYKDKIFPNMTDEEVSVVIGKIIQAAKSEANKGKKFKVTEESLKDNDIKGLNTDYLHMIKISTE